MAGSWLLQRLLTNLKLQLPWPQAYCNGSIDHCHLRNCGLKWWMCLNMHIISLIVLYSHEREKVKDLLSTGKRMHSIAICCRETTVIILLDVRGGSYWLIDLPGVDVCVCVCVFVCTCVYVYLCGCVWKTASVNTHTEPLLHFSVLDLVFRWKLCFN